MNKKLSNLINRTLDKIVEKSIKNYKPKNKFASPTVHTYGDFILNLEYFLLKRKENNNLVYLTIKSYPADELLPFFLGDKKNIYKFYDEKLFLLFYNLIKIIYRLYNKIFNKKKNNLLIQLNQKMLDKLQIYSELKFYQNQKKLSKKQKNEIISSKIFKNYKLLKKYLYILKKDYNFPTLLELNNLRKKFGVQLSNDKIFNKNIKDKLFDSLKIKKRYVCLYLRPYFESFEKKEIDLELDPRCTSDISSFYSIINHLKLLNFDIVLVGKNKFNKKLNDLGVINYSSSQYQNIVNDMYIYYYCEFMIANPGGPSVYPWIFDKPCLALNATTFWAFPNWEKYIYHPKKIIDIKKKKQLKFSEIINNPIIYEQGNKSYNLQNLMTEDLTEKELLESTKYFIEQYNKKDFNQDLHLYSKMYDRLSFYHLGFKESFSRISEKYLNSIND